MESFSHLLWLMVFHWSLSDNKFPQISRNLLSILTDLKNAVVWMVFICPPIFNSSSPLSNLFGILPSAPTTIGITVHFKFHIFFSSLAWSKYFSIFPLDFIFAKLNIKITVTSILVGEMGTISKSMEKRQGEQEIRGRIETIETTAVLKSLRILRRVQGT